MGTGRNFQTARTPISAEREREEGRRKERKEKRTEGKRGRKGREEKGGKWKGEKGGKRGTMFDEALPTLVAHVHQQEEGTDGKRERGV